MTSSHAECGRRATGAVSRLRTPAVAAAVVAVVVGWAAVPAQAVKAADLRDSAGALAPGRTEVTCEVNDRLITGTVIVGTERDDRIECESGVPVGATVEGGAGNDTIVITGRDGVDLDNRADGQNGNRGSVVGGDGDDTISITGGKGADRKGGGKRAGIGGRGNDGVVKGGGGKDTITLTGGAGGQTTCNKCRGVAGGIGVANVVEGGPGADEITVTGGAGGSATNGIGGRGGDGTSFEMLMQTENDPIIHGNDGNDIVVSRGGVGGRGHGQGGNGGAGVGLAEVHGDNGDDGISAIGGEGGGEGPQQGSAGSGMLVASAMYGGDGTDILLFRAGKKSRTEGGSSRREAVIHGGDGTDLCLYWPDKGTGPVTGCEELTKWTE